MKYYDLRKELLEIAKANKAGSRFTMLDNDFDEMLFYIDEMNSIDRNETIFYNYQLEEIKIPGILKGMIVPNSVTVSGNRLQADYLERQTVDNSLGFKFSKTRWLELCDTFRAQFSRNEDSKEESLSDLRKDVTLDKILSISSFEDSVSVAEFEAFYPIQLNVNVWRTNQFYLNDVNEVVYLQFRDEIRNFKFGK